MMSYSIGYAEAGREEAKPELFGSLDEKAPTDEFVFAQIRHEGAWNVHPGRVTYRTNPADRVLRPGPRGGIRPLVYLNLPAM